MVEYQHAGGAGDFGDEALGFGIIDPAQFVLVIEVAHSSIVLNQGKTFAVERQARRYWADIIDRHAAGLGDASRARHARRRIVG